MVSIATRNNQHCKPASPDHRSSRFNHDDGEDEDVQVEVSVDTKATKSKLCCILVTSPRSGVQSVVSVPTAMGPSRNDYSPSITETNATADVWGRRADYLRPLSPYRPSRSRSSAADSTSRGRPRRSCYDGEGKSTRLITTGKVDTDTARKTASTSRVEEASRYRGIYGRRVYPEQYHRRVEVTADTSHSCTLTRPRSNRSFSD